MARRRKRLLLRLQQHHHLLRLLRHQLASRACLACETWLADWLRCAKLRGPNSSKAQCQLRRRSHPRQPQLLHLHLPKARSSWMLTSLQKRVQRCARPPQPRRALPSQRGHHLRVRPHFASHSLRLRRRLRLKPHRRAWVRAACIVAQLQARQSVEVSARWQPRRRSRLLLRVANRVLPQRRLLLCRYPRLRQL